MVYNGKPYWFGGIIIIFGNTHMVPKPGFCNGKNTHTHTHGSQVWHVKRKPRLLAKRSVLFQEFGFIRYTNSHVKKKVLRIQTPKRSKGKITKQNICLGEAWFFHEGFWPFLLGPRGDTSTNVNGAIAKKERKLVILQSQHFSRVDMSVPFFWGGS